MLQPGVGFVSLREGFDLNTPAERLVVGVLTSIATYKTEVSNERLLASIGKTKTDGKTSDSRRLGM